MNDPQKEIDIIYPHTPLGVGGVPFACCCVLVLLPTTLFFTGFPKGIWFGPEFPDLPSLGCEGLQAAQKARQDGHRTAGGLHRFLQDDEDQHFLPLISDNQGNIFAMLNQSTRKMPTAKMQLVLSLHQGGCQLAPSHVKRDLNTLGG